MEIGQENQMVFLKLGLTWSPNTYNNSIKWELSCQIHLHVIFDDQNVR